MTHSKRVLFHGVKNMSFMNNSWVCCCLLLLLLCLPRCSCLPPHDTWQVTRQDTATHPLSHKLVFIELRVHLSWHVTPASPGNFGHFVKRSEAAKTWQRWKASFEQTNSGALQRQVANFIVHLMSIPSYSRKYHEKYGKHHYFLSWREPWNKFEDWDWFNAR